MKTRIPAILIFLLLPLFSFSQQFSKKEAKESSINTVSEWETDLRERRPRQVLEAKETYDKNGNLIEILEADNAGLITLHESYEYDSAGNKIIEIQYEPNGTIRKKHVYTYTNNLRIERNTFDRNGNKIGQKKYIYEFFEK